MKVSMADINKKGNMIINQVVQSGEIAVIVKHGKAIAEIRPLVDSKDRDRAIDYIASLEPVKVSTPLDQIIEEGRKRGL
jgi:antitoxin (DNA-binding transcriptional repressor) of toxin-antitoxin stability system